MCGKKLFKGKQPIENFTVKNFGTEEKPERKIVCGDCEQKYKRAFGSAT